MPDISSIRHVEPTAIDTVKYHEQAIGHMPFIMTLVVNEKKKRHFLKLSTEIILWSYWAYSDTDDKFSLNLQNACYP